ncbi:MAG: ribosome biogenesis GTP-binding protein YihA/YsxC [Ruminococcus sp.]|nr:ribosome biogenesis GTP-binding protein YihA/YsxC [Ruminococcus sp.]
MNFSNAEFITSFGKLSQLPKSDRPEICFSGRSNVGKSTLINRVLNRKALAKVSSVPGKTVTINFFGLDNIYLVDLPGYGYAKVSKGQKQGWNTLIGGYLNDPERQLALIIQLVDMRHAPSKEDLQMINFYIDNELPFVIVLTKADKLNKTERRERMEAFAQEIPCFEDITVIEFSAVTREGIEQVRTVIEQACEDFEAYDYEEASNEADEASGENAPYVDENGYLIPKRKRK